MRPGRRFLRRIYSRHLLNQALPKACRSLYSEDGPCGGLWKLSITRPGPFPCRSFLFDGLPGRGSSAAGLGAAPRSGASRSSSPAMPTSVKSAYRRA